MEKFIFNECVYLGSGARVCLSDELKKRGFKKILIVTDATIIKSGVLQKVTEGLDGSVGYSIFSDIKPNPTVKNVLDGLAVLKKSKANAIVAVGGGSVIDTAKAIAIIKEMIPLNFSMSHLLSHKKPSSAIFV